MGCEWTVDRTCLPELPPENDPDYEAKLTARGQNEQIAIAVLFALSGRQFMCSEKIVRPSPTNPAGLCDDGPLIEAYYRNDWRGVGPGKPSPMTILLEGPVYDIVTVTLDDQDLDPSEYVLEGDVLYRIGKRWPSNNMSLPRGYPGTWSVTYIQGAPPPIFMPTYVGRLASEMIVACEDAKRCKLPRTVISTSRSGVTHVFDPTRMLRAGFTGIPEIDTWLASVNPNNLQSTARVR